MTSDSHDIPHRPPDEGEPPGRPRDVLDCIDESVARITDADIDWYLFKVLRRAGYSRRDDKYHGDDDKNDGDQWRTPIVSNSAACVEVGHVGRAIAVRDTKDRKGPRLVLSADCWQTFTSAVRDGTLPTKPEPPG